MWTSHGLFTLAWISGVAALAGALFVALAPRGWPVVVSALVGAPCVAAGVLSLIMFFLGVLSGFQAGWGIRASLASGLAAGVLYGFGASIYGTPGALLGGGIGALVRRYCLRAERRTHDDSHVSLN